MFLVSLSSLFHKSRTVGKKLSLYDLVRHWGGVKNLGFLRDRPFNLKGGVMVFCFVQNFFFRTTQELEYLFFLSRKARNFFQNLTLGYMTKTLNQIIFFFLHQNQNIFFSNIGNQNIFLEKNHSELYVFFIGTRHIVLVVYSNYHLVRSNQPERYTLVSFF